MERGDRRGVWALAGHRRQGARQSPTLSQLQVAALAFVVVSFTFTLLLLWQPTVCCHQGLNVVSRPLPPQPPTPPTAIFRMQLARPNLAAAKSNLLSRKPHLAACASPPGPPPQPPPPLHAIAACLFCVPLQTLRPLLLPCCPRYPPCSQPIPPLSPPQPLRRSSAKCALTCFQARVTALLPTSSLMLSHHG